MLECLILGDSIGVGVSQVRTECVSHAVQGYTSKQWNNKFITNNLTAKCVIISLGSNDHKAIKTRKELETLRELVKADRVFWILPAIKPDIQEIVKEVAKENGDTVLPILHLEKDNVHPTRAGYKELANATK